MWHNSMTVLAQADNAALFISEKWRLWAYALIFVFCSWQIIKRIMKNSSGSAEWGSKGLLMTVFHWGIIMALSMWIVSANGQTTLRSWINTGSAESERVVGEVTSDRACDNTNDPLTCIVGTPEGS